jgi:hypothetical protein
MWRILGLILAAILILSVIGFVIDALRSLLWLALVLAGIAVVVGYFGGQGDRSGRR